jgi:hypothetical protein
VSEDSLWQWVQHFGQSARQQEEPAVTAWQGGAVPVLEPLSEELAALPLLMGADGVTVPLRPQVGTPKGQTRWREVKVALLARLTHRFNRAGQRRTHLQHRRLVARMTDIAVERLVRTLINSCLIAVSVFPPA